MQTPTDNPLLALVDRWATHFGYYDGKIDVTVGDLSSVTTPECTLTAHAPLWRTKPGQEKAVAASDVRKQLAKMLKVTRIARHDMHLALHPDGTSLCLFFVVKARFPVLPFTVMTVPLAFVVHAVETSDGLRIDEIHERPAADPQAAVQVLIEQHNWPAETTMKPYKNFGAAS